MVRYLLEEKVSEWPIVLEKHLVGALEVLGILNESRQLIYSEVVLELLDGHGLTLFLIILEDRVSFVEFSLNLNLSSALDWKLFEFLCLDI